VNLAVKLRRGEGRFWGTLKWLARKALRVHLPVFWLTRPLFRFLYVVHVGARLLTARAVRFFWSEPLFRSQCDAIGSGFQMGPLPYLHGQGRIVLGDDVTFGGKPDFVFGNRGDRVPELVVGNRVYIGHMCCFAVSASVRLGNDCLLAGGVHISDYDGHPIDAARRRAGEPSPPEAVRPVTIGNDVWIGNHAMILKGVTVGDRAIIAAQAVVTHDVPPDTVVAGNPARVVKHLVGESAP
jgi:acetyltransferase-like isoleucine patch superfamily enzyme